MPLKDQVVFSAGKFAIILRSCFTDTEAIEVRVRASYSIEPSVRRAK